jgi:hypothetical protein
LTRHKCYYLNLHEPAMSAYASDWPPPSPAAPLPEPQPPLTKDAYPLGSDEEKKQSESDMSLSPATTPPSRSSVMAAAGKLPTERPSPPTADAVRADQADGAADPKLPASASSESLVRVGNNEASAGTTLPPPEAPPGEEGGSRSPRERLVERLPHDRPLGPQKGKDSSTDAVDLINLQPRQPPQPQPAVPDVAMAASPGAAFIPASMGLSVPSPPSDGGLLSTPSRQGMVPMYLPGSATMRPAYEAMASNVSSYAQLPPGRRCIRLRLVEEVSPVEAAAAEDPSRRSGLRSSILNSFRKKHRGRTMSDVTGNGTATAGSADRVGSPLTAALDPHKRESSGSLGSAVVSQQIDRGHITVSWYDGTGSAELNDHVLRSVRRKLGLAEGIVLRDVRIIDETVEPSEEIVLCPYIPDGSVFLLKFSLRDENAERRAAEEKRFRDEEERRRVEYRSMESYISEAPESPSAAPSPHPSSLDLVQLGKILTASGLVAPLASPPVANGIAMAAAKTKGPSIPPLGGGLGEEEVPKGVASDMELTKDEATGVEKKTVSFQAPVKSPEETKTKEGEGENMADSSKGEDDKKIKDVLRQLSQLLGVDDGSDGKHRHRRRHRDRSEERKQVVFVLANYFVLFLSLIVISAEIHERAPRWMDWARTHVDSVQSCSKDSDALYKCVSEGNLAGLVASIIFWITRSAFTKNILLFGFDSPQKLWTVVYEALVSALCWGTSYIFIRRGLNPDTRRHFLYKYWKDAIYGSLAGFNAAFLKAVLKNLIPQDQVLDALETRQLRVVGWLSHIFRNEVEDF